MILAARDRDGRRVRIDAVLDEFGDRFQGITLRERDDADRVPIIPDAQLAAVFALRFRHRDGNLGGILVRVQHESLTGAAGQAQELERPRAPGSIARTA